MPGRRFAQPAGPFSLAELSAAVGAELAGSFDGSKYIKDVATPATANRDELCFFNNIRFAAALEASSAGACLIKRTDTRYLPPATAPLVCDDPSLAFTKITRIFYPHARSGGRISPDARVHPSATIGEGSRIDAFAVVEDGVEIGARCHIGSGTVLGSRIRIGDDCEIGDNVTMMFSIVGNGVRIQSGARIGTEGFGFTITRDGICRIPHVGRVLIGNDVGIGANTTIVRGTIEDTVIGNGVMIDNLVHIAHNVQLGDGVVIAGQAGVAGSAVIGDFAMLGGKSGVSEHATLGSRLKLGAMSRAIGSLEAGETYVGVPAIPVAKYRKIQRHLRRKARQD